MSEIVTEVSATFVATTTFRVPGGANSNARRCAAGGSDPCKATTLMGTSLSLRLPSISAQQRSISRAPERKTSTAPGTPFNTTCSIVASSSAPSTSAASRARDTPFAERRPTITSTSSKCIV